MSERRELNRVGVFRNAQLLPSEPFISSQAQALARYTPTLIGRDRFATSGPPGHSLADFDRIALVRYRLGDRKAITPFLNSFDLDVLHAHFGVDATCVWGSAQEIGVPFVVTLHGFDVTLDDAVFSRSLKPAMRQYAKARSALFASRDVRFVAVSNYVASRAIDRGLDATRVTVIPTGVDTEAIARTPLPVHPRIVHVARLVEVKGTADLLHAFTGVVRAVPDAHLDIVGDGPLRAELEALTRELKIASSVTFHGALPHKDTLKRIAASRVLCLPSLTTNQGAAEGLGQVTLEAMAMGRLVVATRSGGIPEVVENEVNGLLVPERARAQLGNALVSLLLDSGFGEMAAAARRSVEARYDLRSRAVQLEAVYDDARRRSDV